MWCDQLGNWDHLFDQKVSIFNHPVGLEVKKCVIFLQGVPLRKIDCYRFYYFKKYLKAFYPK